VMALKNVGIDLSQVVMMLNGEKDDSKKVKDLTRALRMGLSAKAEADRAQPSGFAGPVVASFLMVTRDMVRASGKDAHAAMEPTRLPIPAALPAGSVAIPALSILILERILAEIDTNGGQSNDESRLTNSA